MSEERVLQVQPYRTRLCHDNAYWMARLAQVAYRKKQTAAGEPDTDAILNELQAEDPDFIEVTPAAQSSAEAILVEHKHYWCFSFRGTDEILDWKDNVDFFPARALFGEFHRGFLASTDDVWETLYPHYRERHKEDRERGNARPVFLTGHSLGGAMATVAAAKLIHADQPFTSAYTFGQPRAMTLDTARIFNVEARQRFHRFQNNCDIVTRLPARVMGYSHVGSCLYIAQGGRIHDDVGFWFRFLDTVKANLAELGDLRLEGVEDHNIEDYLKAIRAWDFSAD